MSTTSAAPGEIKARLRETLEARVRARLERVRVALTSILELRPGENADIEGGKRLPTTMRLNVHTQRLTHVGNGRGPGPEDFERAITFTEGLAHVAAEAENIVAHTVATIWERVHSPLVPGNLRRAVLSRDDLAARWPWDEHHEPSAVLMGLIFCVEPMLLLRPNHTDVWIDEPIPYRWPDDVAPRSVADWAEPLLKREREALAVFRMQSEKGSWGMFDTPWRALAVLYVVRQSVEKGTTKRAMAIDAGRPHHDLLMGWRDLPKDTKTGHTITAVNGRIELIDRDGSCVQLTLDLDGAGRPSEALVHALQTMRGWEGLRHWAAIQKLLSVDGGRQGWVRWTLDGHLDALGYSVKNRSKDRLRRHVAGLVETFARFQLAAYAADGTLRERKALLLVGAKYDRLKGSEWQLDGMQVMINPLLYTGVREAGGKLGRNWHPAPVELAKVNHKHHPYTYPLGLILPIRWRLALNEGHEHVTLTGENALRLAKIKYYPHDRVWLSKHGGDAWRALERDLTELQRVGGLGRWEWDAADTPRTLVGRLHFWQADWVADRTIHEVRPLERPAEPAVLTGVELKTWRTRHSLTQAEAAETLHVNPRTLIRAEARPLEPLSKRLAAKIREAGA